MGETLQVFILGAEEWTDVLEHGVRPVFYLEGYLLDAYVKFLITKANETIIVVNPFLDMITPTKLLIEATRKNKRVVLVTRPPNKTSTRNYHKELLNKKI